MKFTQLFTKTLREAPAEETAVNARYLIRGGFVSKVTAGVYEFLPLGLRVLNKINTVIRQEMNAIGGQELNMSVFQNKDIWQATGRWKDAEEVMFQFKDKGGHEYGLGFTHEEPLTAVARHFISSYKDLPKAVYQIQTKFRNEPRAKSGLLRGREFLMKDLYSFHASQEDLDIFYEDVARAYLPVFDRIGIPVIRTLASGGMFSKFSDEFQTPAAVGEDTIFIHEKSGRAINKEIYTDEVLIGLGWKKDELKEETAIEAGNIFKLGTRFSESLGLLFTDKNGEQHPVIMASYGIGPSRLMATAVEISHDKKGIIWPEHIAPFHVHLVALDGSFEEAEKLYHRLLHKKVEVLFDDRNDKSAGEKFADADLIGCPIRLVVSKKTLNSQSLEVKRRHESKIELVKIVSWLDSFS